MTPRLVVIVALLPTLARAQAELGLDLSPESNVKSVVLIPPIYKHSSSEGGSFAGFSSTKVTERLDTASHRKLVSALEKKLGKGKVISADATARAISKEGLKPAALRTATGMAQLAKATESAWVLFYSYSEGTLSAAIYDLFGEATGKSAQVLQVQPTTLSAAKAEVLQQKLTEHLVELSKPKAEEVATKVAPPPPEEEVTGEVESEIERDQRAQRSIIHPTDLTRPRVLFAVGFGGSVRSQSLRGDLASDLSAQSTGALPGIALFAQVNPLHFLPGWSEGPYSDAFIDAHYRRSFMKATGQGSLAGQSCSVLDDEFQIRGNFRWRLGGMLPSVGLGAGWAQERSVYTSCSFPVASAIYRGIDVQLKVRQPIFRDWVALDVSVGPRALLTGPLAPKGGLSWAFEGWVEAKPISLIFVRGGARVFRAVLSDGVGVASTDLRTFFAFEAGVHL